MAYVNIWLHCVWGTKNRIPYLTEELLDKVIIHIKENAIDKNIFIDTINGYKDHIHCLLGLDANMTLSKVIQLLKGESSCWINRNKLTNLRFEWAVEYYCSSISESQLQNVRKYIISQPEHHRFNTWEDENYAFIS